LEDQAEVQKILHIAARNFTGSIIDLTSPPCSPKKFCGEGLQDQLAVQEILWASAREVHGSQINVCESPPVPPMRKKTKRREC